MKNEFRAHPITLNVRLIPETQPVCVLHLGDVVPSTSALQEKPLITYLTPREKEVISWIAQGKTNREIAMMLNRSEATVKTHVRHILTKLRTTSRTQAVALWASMHPTTQGYSFENLNHGHE